MKTLYCLSGMPRSGSRLLANILAQNPRFHIGCPSGLIEVIFLIRNKWNEWATHRSMPEEMSNEKLTSVLRSIISGYYQRAEENVVIDVDRGWLAYVEMAEALLDHPVKVIVTVRDLRDILASFEILWRNMAAKGQLAQEREHYAQMQSVGGRCQVWMRDDQPVGLAYNRVHDALIRGHASKMYFVQYERLTEDPEGMVAGIYEFLGEEYWQHDFQNVEQVIVEDDRVHGIAGLHDIRPVVEIQPPKRSVLGSVADAYKGPYPWDIHA